MHIQPQSVTDLTVRSFAYAAKQLAQSPVAQAPNALYEQVLSEAEKYRSAVRLVQRDVFEMTDQGLRMHTLSRTEFQQLRDSAAQVVAQALEAITRIVAQYSPQKLAA